MRNLYKKQAGYTLLEIILVIFIIAIILATVGIKFAPALISFNSETVAANLISTLHSIHRDALRGSSNPTQKFTFNLNNFAGNYASITVKTTPPIATATCGTCPTNQQQICVDKEVYCYDPNGVFDFTPNSGRLQNNHVLFVTSQYRKLAVLISMDSHTEVIELIGNKWYPSSKKFN